MGRESRFRSGTAVTGYWVAALAREYGFADIDGRLPGVGQKAQLPDDIPDFWKQVQGID